MKFNTKYVFTSGLIVGAIAVSQAYTNCSASFQAAGPIAGVTSFVAPLPLDHPADDKITVAPQQAPPLAHREYFSTLLHEVFTNPDSPGDYVNQINGQLIQWTTTQGAQLGQACNPYETPSGRDCGGDITNANLPLNQSDTVVREALRIHVCEEILGHDEAITAALSKIEGDPTTDPSANSIKEMTTLFYRGDLPSQTYLDLLTSLNSDMKAKNVNSTDRWRMLLLQVCEASDWQLL